MFAWIEKKYNYYISLQCSVGFAFGLRDFLLQWKVKSVRLLEVVQLEILVKGKETAQNQMENTTTANNTFLNSFCIISKLPSDFCSSIFL